MPRRAAHREEPALRRTKAAREECRPGKRLSEPPAAPTAQAAPPPPRPASPQ